MSFLEKIIPAKFKTITKNTTSTTTNTSVNIKKIESDNKPEVNIEEMDLGLENSFMFNVDAASDIVHSRKDGLDINSSKFLSDEDKESIKKLIAKKNPDMTSNGIDEELNKLMQACSDYSVSHGCGAYSILALRNAKSNDKETKESFFGHTLLNSLGTEKWYEIMDRQLKKNGGGPLTTDDMSKVLDYYGYSYENLGHYTSESFSKDDKSGNYQKILEHLKQNKPVVLMVGRKDEGLDKGYSRTTFSSNEQDTSKELGKKANVDDTWAKSFHYILLAGADDNNKVTIIDSRSFDYENYKNIRYSNYSKLISYIASNTESTDRYSKYAGCILID